MALAEERSHARLERDWPRADELKARIEAAGWRVVDDGPAFTLHPARTPDLVEDGQTWYGAVESVPSRLEEAATAAASVVVIAPPDGTVDDALRALAAHRSVDVQVVVVAPRPVSVAGPCDELVPTVEPFSAGDALQAALRRATGAVVVVLDPRRVVSGDPVGPLVAALDDPGVAMAGSDGLSSTDLHRYLPARGSVTTLTSGCYAFRRADAIARGPIDGRLRLPDSVATWLGLQLRDAGEEAPPRRALVVELPLGPTPEPAEGHDPRAARRDGYRIADRFGEATWLAADEPPEGRIVGDGAEHDGGADDDEESG